jgi:glutathione synthase/RimK-type ligase-like ATP-grasp enzyme
MINMSEKTQAELLKEELFATSSHAAYTCPDEEIAQADAFCEGYKEFLNKCKTEREAAAYVKSLAEAKGYVAFNPKATYKAGDKVYADIRS